MQLGNFFSPLLGVGQGKVLDTLGAWSPLSHIFCQSIFGRLRWCGSYNFEHPDWIIIQSGSSWITNHLGGKWSLSTRGKNSLLRFITTKWAGLFTGTDSLEKQSIMLLWLLWIRIDWPVPFQFSVSALLDWDEGLSGLRKCGTPMAGFSFEQSSPSHFTANGFKHRILEGQGSFFALIIPHNQKSQKVHFLKSLSCRWKTNFASCEKTFHVKTFTPGS